MGDDNSVDERMVKMTCLINTLVLTIILEMNDKKKKIEFYTIECANQRLIIIVTTVINIITMNDDINFGVNYPFNFIYSHLLSLCCFMYISELYQLPSF